MLQHRVRHWRIHADHHHRLAGGRQPRQLERRDVDAGLRQRGAYRTDDPRLVAVARDQHQAGQLGVDLEAGEAGHMRAAMGRRTGQAEGALALARLQRDQGSPRGGGIGPGLADGEAALARDQVGIDGVDTLVGHGFQDPGQRGRADGGAVPLGDLARVGQGDAVEGGR